MSKQSLNRDILFPGTGPASARSVWLLLAIMFALLPLIDLPRAAAASCGALSLVSAGIALRRWILFTAIAAIVTFIGCCVEIEVPYRWFHDLVRVVLG
ncbi:MAG TPA: hypothetical protein P5077_02710 [bacterium]|nr:hypothetical protein [bacterium]